MWRALFWLGVLWLGIAWALTACASDAVMPVGSGSAAPPGTPLAGDAANGKTKFAASCASCHGIGAKGITMLGKSLVGTAFIQNISDADLVAFIRKGRLADDPANTTRIEMPARGGDSTLTEQDLVDIVVYLRGLQK